MSRAHATGETVAAASIVPRWLSRPLAVLTVVAVLAPAAASAVTVDQVLELSKAGVSDAVILALIDRDRTVFSLEAEQIVTLHRDGLSDPIILAMLKSGRKEGEDAARAASASNAAMIAAALTSAPEVAFVGHGPDVPNTAHSSNFSAPLVAGVMPVPYAVPYATPNVAPSVRRRGTPFSQAPRTRGFEPPALCLASVSAAGSASSLTFVTECPQRHGTR